VVVFLKNPCDIDSCDNNFCVSDNDFQSCEGETVYCSIFEDPQDGSCVDEPPFCYETKVCLSGYDPNCPYDTFTCDGNAPCENLLENECGDYGVCTSNNDISECTQIFFLRRTN